MHKSKMFKKRMRKTFFFIVILIFLLPNVTATKHMILLAVKEGRDNLTGSLADLYLDIQPGSGRVFLETFPLTKLDTQLSTRFAKEIACSFLDVNCNNYDFFYTIEAESGIVGGPSAGAAIAVLTVAALKNLELDENTAITGTINSGGFIGFVGGLKEKIDAAAEAGIKKVLVPSADVNVKINNKIMNLTQYAKEKGIEVIEVASLGEAVYEFTGEYSQEVIEELAIDPNYKQTMHELAILLCNKSSNLKKLLDFNTTGIDNLTEKAYSAIKDEKYYTAASYCFGANYKYRTLLFQNLTIEEIKNKIENAKKEIKEFNISTESIKTITDLQTYIITKNRLSEAMDYLNKSLDNINNTKESSADLAYAIERIFSAYSWMKFFGKGKKEIKLDEKILKTGCLNKLAEAEERYSYANIYFPLRIREIKTKINKAKSHLEAKEYELCLFEASKAKASADVILSSLGASKEQLNKILDAKINLVKIAINKQIKQGVWPIIGYSYYEYANSLKEDDPYSALLYSEYALELSDLDPYLKERKQIEKISTSEKTEIKPLFIFVLGIVLGFVTGFIIQRMYKNPRKRPKRASISGKKR